MTLAEAMQQLASLNRLFADREGTNMQKALHAATSALDFVSRCAAGVGPASLPAADLLKRHGIDNGEGK